ncbi:glycosyltransferase [Methyloversatilis sp. XJ19-13]|uniref:glycosyltransferase n=1 Tax=Methyloversatilis sp. XJ19-13 TaxID=2963430 RepID=UPI00211BB6AE|nr:glycosyltransferase [Methyloversatilis sp. XJ19-13]MCQ9372889.1 glycosyltransferase [Methyloversatilis sp. XJ19-13]
MKILLVAEGATLAHVSRPLVLADAFTGMGHEVVLAAPVRYAWTWKDAPFEVMPLDAQSPEIFARRLAAGDPLYDFATLDRYVDLDRTLIRDVRPDLIVGDFRLSLCVSARLEQVRYVSLSNAYWSPYFVQSGAWPVPDLPLTRFLPISVATPLFNLVRPFAFAQHAKPMNALRRKHGLGGFGRSLQAVYTDADAVAYCDVPSLFKLRDAPPNHRVIGPLLWSPACEAPPWMRTLPPDKSVVYMTLGSSGRADLVQPIAAALSEAGHVVLMSTAGADAAAQITNVYSARFLPGLDACRVADVVVCNGGSPTTQQALAAGKPVLGVASNLDQFLNMQTLEGAGVGEVVRADRFTPSGLIAGVSNMLAHQGAVTRARKCADEMSALSSSVVAAQILHL